MYGREGGFNRSGGGFVPVKVGDELDVKIEAVGEKGDGIAKKDGFVLFVPNTKEGEQVKVRVTKVLRKVGFAEVVGASGKTGAEKKSAGALEPEVPEEEEPVEDTEDFGEEQPAEEEPELPEPPKEEKEFVEDETEKI